MPAGEPVLRVAVIGSGPAGVYATQALTRQGGVVVDVFDGLPCPFGLVRYGVAPDHPKTRSITGSLHAVLEHPDVRFLGNVQIGVDLTLQDLHRHYDAVLVANGAAVDRRLGIPGEDLAGSFSATDLVAWYNGHPDVPVDQFTLEARTVIVVGMGNVAIDVARMLIRSAADLRVTDLPEPVLQVFERSHVQDVHVVARRGPAQAKFTTQELRELGDLTDVDVMVDAQDLDLDVGSQAIAAGHLIVARNLEVLADWAQRSPQGRSRRLHLHFWLRPVRVLGKAQVSGVAWERVRPDHTANAQPTGHISRLDADMLVRAVGYRGTALPGLPFDEMTGTIPNASGRVLRDGITAPGEYVAGWTKRGPTGLIGTNRRDANETVAALLADAPNLRRAAIRDREAILKLLTSRGVPVVTWAGWRAIDRAEVDLGKTHGRPRIRISERPALLHAASRHPTAEPDGKHRADDTAPRPQPWQHDEV